MSPPRMAQNIICLPARHQKEFPNKTKFGSTQSLKQKMPAIHLLQTAKASSFLTPVPGLAPTPQRAALAVNQIENSGYSPAANCKGI